MRLLALHGLELGFKEKFIELIYGQHDSDGHSAIVAEAASDLLATIGNTLPLAPLSALYRPDWLSLGALELLASTQKPEVFPSSTGSQNFITPSVSVSQLL